MSQSSSPSPSSSQVHLLLVPDSEEQDNGFDFDGEGQNDLDDLQLGSDEGATKDWDALTSSALVSLPAHILYLVSPTLNLGSVYLLQLSESESISSLPRTTQVLVLLFMSFLSAFSSQIFLMLGQYVRKWSIEDVTMEAFSSRGRGTENNGGWIRIGVKGLVGTCSLLLCAMYLRESTILVLPLLHPKFPSPWETVPLITTLFLAILLLPNALSSRRLLSATSLSVLAYVALLGTLFFHRRAQNGNDDDDNLWKRDLAGHIPVNSALWDFTTTTAFAFATQLLIFPLSLSYHRHYTPSTLSTSTKRHRPPSTTYPLIVLFSALLSFFLLLPLLLIPPSTENTTPSAIPTLQSLSLVLSIPSIYIISLTPRLSSLKLHPTIKYIPILLIPVLSWTPLLPIVLTLTLIISYLLPAILHIILHAFRPPLSILSASTDEFLRRKEQSLQKRRLWRRIGWDFGVWILLMPLAGLVVGWSVRDWFHE